MDTRAWLDGYANDPARPLLYAGKKFSAVMGSLVALNSDSPIETLRSEPTRILAHALLAYSAYIIDDTT